MLISNRYRIAWVVMVLLFGWLTTSGQQTYWKAERVNNAPEIDGTLNEEIWSEHLINKEFIVHQPNPGEVSGFKNEIAILYDDVALYIGARLHDPSPDSIIAEYSPRDEFDHTDWFQFTVGPYRDGQNAFKFIITPVEIQYDARITSEGEDAQWDAVWKAQCEVRDEAWIVEMEIPYAALRFPEEPEQLWEMNLGRYIRRIRQESYWSFVDPEQSGFINQAGYLGGIKNISPPIRLQLLPYLSTHLSKQEKEKDWNPSGGAGMDLKYGINDAFTLDMTIVPDFSQVAPDDNVLNLSPFEVNFEERRPFFTEGIELFNKSGLFYSRRVGKSSTYQQFNTDRLRDQGYHFTESVQDPQLINAAKVTGRTSGGTGLGMFNAITARQTARVVLDETEQTVEIEPLTNYNTLVFDQNLKHNSFVNLTNTNVWRNGRAYDANATGVEFAYHDSTITYRWRGGAKLSQQFFTDGTNRGHQYNFAFEKVGGNLRFTSGFYIESDTYNTNDLGFLSSNNEKNGFVGLEYVRHRPIFGLTRMNASLRADYQRHYDPDVFRTFDLSFNSFFMTDDFFAFGLNASLQPVEARDYFEARTPDFSAYYTLPENFSAGGFISTDYRRDFAIDVNTSYTGFDEADRYGLYLAVEPRVRLTDKIFFILETSYNYQSGDVGYVFPSVSSIGYPSLEEDDIIFGRRDRRTSNTVFSGRYVFNARLSLELRIRHYWSKVKYRHFYLLGEEGGLLNTEYRGTSEQGTPLHDLRFTSYATNMVIKWRFAPGSDLIFVWKNSLDDTFREPHDASYWRDFDHAFNQAKDNIISLKAIFYLDYYTFTGKRKLL